MTGLNPFTEDMPVENLTWRERDILRLLADRLTNKEIANRLHLAESTVKDYVSRILGKINVRNRREAVERGRKLGLLVTDRKTLTRTSPSLPVETTPFIGRQVELAQILQSLDGTRLLTISGPGGIGKSRLALKAASEACGSFEDGCYFVPLAPIHQIEDLTQTIAESLNFPLATSEDPTRQLTHYLRNKELLLVMDNFEHLLAGVSLVREVLQSAPGIKIMATSRERLNLQDETILTLGGMSYPETLDLVAPTDYDAVNLFIQRARKVQPGFDPDSDTLEIIISICRSVQGMPLAIELSAAWLSLLSVAEIASELTRDPDVILAASGARDTPDRHHSIRTVFNHSWSLLDSSEQQTLMLLSVFRGGFTREAAQSVTGASLPILVGLVNKSFLSHNTETDRLEVHELLRQYAHERLGSAKEIGESAQTKHAAYYAAFMQKGWADLKSDRQMQSLVEIEADIENVRTAWRYYRERSNALQMRSMICGIWYIYWIRGWHYTGMELFNSAASAIAFEKADELQALRALAMAFESHFMSWSGLAENGYKLAKESAAILEHLEDPEALVWALYSQMVNAYMFNKLDELTLISNRMMAVVRGLNDKWLQAFVTFAASMNALIESNFPEARRLAEENIVLTGEIGDVISSSLPRIILGHEALARSAYEEARDYYLQCLHTAEESGFHYALQTVTKYLGKVNILIGDTVEAEKYLSQCLELTSEIGFVRDLVNMITEFARLHAARGDPKTAVELLAFVLKHPASRQSRLLEGTIRHSAQDLLKDLESEISEEDYRTAIAAGTALDLDAVVIRLLEHKTPA